MANYATAALLTAQAKLATKYNEAEMRRKLRPAVKLAIDNQDYAIPNASALKVAEQRAVEVHYKTRRAAGSSTVKAARHTGTKGDSAKVTLSWVRFTETFSFSRKLLFNKVFGAQEIFNNEVEQAILNLQDRIETAAVTYLLANRMQLAAPTTSGAGTWDNTNKQLVIAAADANYFVQNTGTYLFGRHFRGEYDMLADLLLYPKLERVMNQGAGNQTNTSFQFGKANIMPTTDAMLSTGINAAGQALVLPKGMFAGLTWNDPLNRQGFGRPDDYVGMLTTMVDPFGLGASYDISVYTDRADTSGIDGHVQDIVDEYEISFCIGWALPPMSTANESVVHLIAQGV